MRNHCREMIDRYTEYMNRICENNILYGESVVRVPWNGSIANSPSPTEESHVYEQEGGVLTPEMLTAAWERVRNTHGNWYQASTPMTEGLSEEPMTRRKVIIRSEDGTSTVRMLAVESDDRAVNIDGVTYTRRGENRAGWPIYTEVTSSYETATQQGVEPNRAAMEEHSMWLSQEDIVIERIERQLDEMERAENPDILTVIQARLEEHSIAVGATTVECLTPKGILLHPYDYDEMMRSSAYSRMYNNYDYGTRGVQQYTYYFHNWSIPVVVHDSVERGTVRIVI